MKDLINDIGLKKILLILGGIVVVVVLIVVGLLLYNNLFSKISYSEIESEMVNAAHNYYNDNAKLLPKNSGDTISINSNALAAGGYMKDLAEYTQRIDETLSCTATVNVTNVNGKYRYIPNLVCGENYSTETLVRHIREKESIVISGEGLYELNGGYVFRGDSPNNYVSFANGREWRIVKIEDDYIYLLYTMEDTKNRAVWDNRYNVERNGNTGINDYLVSRISSFLEKSYSSSFFTDAERMLLTPFDLPIGKRSPEVMANDGSIEKSEILNCYLGLLPAYDFVNASIDENCSAVINNSCANYNYLSYVSGDWWLATASQDSSYEVFEVSGGRVSTSHANRMSNVRPYVRLVKDALYVSGDGTAANPYKIK